MNTATQFDIVVIGSGPGAIAALDALDTSMKIAVVTGAAIGKVPKRNLHPKIRAVADERGREASLAEPITQGRGSKPLFTSAEVGGFANYWGQQFVPYAAGELAETEIFSSHADYLSECGALERLFSIRGGERVSIDEASGLHINVPRLLTGSSDRPAAGLDAMRFVYERIHAALGAHTYSTRAIAMHQDGSDWIVSLEDGQQISAPKILLAAGVKGTAQFLLRSFSDLRSARFRDHCPWMVHVIGLQQFMRHRPEGAHPHFNAINVETMREEVSTGFGSVYDLARADLNLLLASSIGRSSTLLRNRRPPRVLSALNVVQVWTPSTHDIIDIDQGTASAGPRIGQTPEEDAELIHIITSLRRSGARVIKISRTQPGFGFHYHGLRVRAPGQNFQSVLELLRVRTQGAVTCVDASTMGSIGCRPHTLTAMARARRTAAKAAAQDVGMPRARSRIA